MNTIYGKIEIIGIPPLKVETIKDRIGRKITRMSIEKRFRLLAYLG